MTTPWIAPCDRRTAQGAVRRWHYAGALPTGQVDCYGVWEQGLLVGVVVIGRGANPNIGRPFGLPQSAVRDLSRLALGPHETATSRIVARVVDRYRRDHPQVRVLVSYADPSQGHLGTIYQALGWTYLGRVRGISGAVLKTPTGRVHMRTASHRGLRFERGILRRLITPPRKHRYALALDPALRPVLAALARPYPKRSAPLAGSGGRPAGAPPPILA